MGYRVRIYKIEKGILEDLNELKSIEEYERWLKKKNIDDDCFSLYDLGEEFFNFGAYYDNQEEINKTGKPLFSFEEIQDYYEEYSPYIIGKEGVLQAIEHQKNLIVEYYKNVLKENDEGQSSLFFDKTKEEAMNIVLQDKITEWSGNGILNLDENDPTITNSWKYEYSIFELTRLYKTMDWDNYGLMIMGW